MPDLPDYTKKVVLDQTVPPATMAQVDHRKLAGDDLVVPTIAKAIPISVENPALAYDAVNNRFYVSIEGTVPSIDTNLIKVGVTTQTARDWSADLAKLQNIPASPATENGNLATIAGIAFILRATTPTIYNVTMTNANTEYSQALSANTKKFLIATRDRTAFRLAFVTGKVATPTEPYLTVAANEIYFEDLLNFTSKTIFFASASAGKSIEIMEWT